MPATRARNNQGGGGVGVEKDERTGESRVLKRKAGEEEEEEEEEDGDVCTAVTVPMGLQMKAKQRCNICKEGQGAHTLITPSLSGGSDGDTLKPCRGFNMCVGVKE